jgi:hypothetical protein
VVSDLCPKYEHNVLDGEGGRLSQCWRQQAATLGSGRPPQTGAHINQSSDVFSGDTECLYAAPDALRDEGADCYCRVSSAAQRPDLKNQRRVLEDFCTACGVVNVAFIEEVGGGLNFRRPKFVTIMDRVQAREVSHLIVAHKDRLVRFGFQWFERLCTEHGTETAGPQQRRDGNAAINLRRVGVAEGELTCADTMPLPVSSQARQASRG